MVMFLCFAVDVQPDFLLPREKTDLFGGDEGDAGDGADVIAYEGVEKMDGELFVPLRAELPLEPEVGERIDEHKPSLGDDGVNHLRCQIRKYVLLFGAL